MPIACPFVVKRRSNTSPKRSDETPESEAARQPMEVLGVAYIPYAKAKHPTTLATSKERAPYGDRNTNTA